MTQPRAIRIGHSPDADDAFMFYGIVCGAVDTEGFEIEQVLEGIESLNRRALRGELEVSAVSIHAYAYLARDYALMNCGASMGDGYGPIVVAREALTPSDLGACRIAIPGRRTSAALALRLFLGREARVQEFPFEKILEAVARGEADAGLVIHEGQLTYADDGLQVVVDLGHWWRERTGGLPLPLGGNAVRRDLGDEAMRALVRILRRSIEYGLEHREEALAYALQFGRGLDRERTDRFVRMYVNEWTLDYGERGREAVRRFLAEGAAAGVVPPVERLDFIG